MDANHWGKQATARASPHIKAQSNSYENRIQSLIKDYFIDDTLFLKVSYTCLISQPPCILAGFRGNSIHLCLHVQSSVCNRVLWGGVSRLKCIFIQMLTLHPLVYDSQILFVHKNNLMILIKSWLSRPGVNLRFSTSNKLPGVTFAAAALWNTLFNGKDLIYPIVPLVWVLLTINKYVTNQLVLYTSHNVWYFVSSQ